MAVIDFDIWYPWNKQLIETNIILSAILQCTHSIVNSRLFRLLRCGSQSALVVISSQLITFVIFLWINFHDNTRIKVKLLYILPCQQKSSYSYNYQQLIYKFTELHHTFFSTKNKSRTKKRTYWVKKNSERESEKHSNK